MYRSRESQKIIIVLLVLVQTFLTQNLTLPAGGTVHVACPITLRTIMNTGRLALLVENDPSLNNFNPQIRHTCHVMKGIPTVVPTTKAGYCRS
jgi:hypothetical protein